MMSEDAAPTHFRVCCRNVITVLQKIGIETAELDARLMISDALGFHGAAYFMEPDRLLSEIELNQIASRLARRMAGEPVSRIVGKRDFWKHSFQLSPDVLDPRPDSETLVETALDLIKKSGFSNRPIRLLDLGTGSGALLISLVLELPEARGVGVDISQKALDIAEKNSISLNCNDRLDFLSQSWLQGSALEQEKPFDLIICNPPYIPHGELAKLAPDVRDFDPHQALDGGVDGLDPYRQIIPQLGRFLTPEGVVIFEIGAGQEADIVKIFEREGFVAAGGGEGLFADLSGIIRCLAFTR